MGFAKIAPVGNVQDFSRFEVGEFFRFNGNIWVKYNDHAAVNITNNDDDIEQEFFSDAECDNIEVELKVL